jgi:hypothetical protein
MFVAVRASSSNRDVPRGISAVRADYAPMKSVNAPANMIGSSSKNMICAPTRSFDLKTLTRHNRSSSMPQSLMCHAAILVVFCSDRSDNIVRTHIRGQDAPKTAVYCEPRSRMLWPPKSHRIIHSLVTKYDMHVKNILSTRQVKNSNFVKLRHKKYYTIVSVKRCEIHVEPFFFRCLE